MFVSLFQSSRFSGQSARIKHIPKASTKLQCNALVCFAQVSGPAALPWTWKPRFPFKCRKIRCVPWPPTS